MPTKKDAQGRRSLEMQIELPGTPEQVWQAIATGPGITAWFVPTDLEQREGGAVAFHLGPGMTSHGKITGWEPPRRIAYEEPGWSGNAPPLATEFTIEAKAGGTCTVRLVHSLFTSSDEWDDQIDSMEHGWPPFFDVLRVYLTHFAGAAAASAGATGGYAGTTADAWTALLQALSMTDAKPGQVRKTAGNDVPLLAGTVERADHGGRQCALMLRLDQPAPGVALLGTYEWAERVQTSVNLYFYGDDAADVAKRAKASWTAWMQKHFPTPTTSAQA